MRSLAALLPAGRSHAAARALLDARGPVALATGFPVGGRPETDGPVGVLALAWALHALGRSVRLVSWEEALDAFAPEAPFAQRVSVPRGRPAEFEATTAVVTVELCGRQEDGTYRNMRGEDVSAEAPWLEPALGARALVSVGDGGNEFGMGSAPREWFRGRAFGRPVSACEHLVLGQSSNWGSLALVASLGAASGRVLLPEPERYRGWLESLARRGLVDGVTRRAEPTEDGLPLERGLAVLARLRG